MSDAPTTRDHLKKLARRAAATGLAAAGVYSAYQVLAPHQEARSQDPEPAKNVVVRHVWSTSKTYAAQTRFLKLLFSAYDQGRARVADLRRAADQTYAKARPDLNVLFQGALDENLGPIEILPSGAVAVTLGFKPSHDSAHAAYARCRIRYHIGSRTEHIQLGEHESLVGQVMEVRILSFEGKAEGKDDWAAITVPKDMQPTIEKKEEVEGSSNCAYPRWNPQGVKYGFFDKRRLADGAADLAP